MKLIGCDRCKAIFPAGTRHTKLRIFDTTHDVIEDDAAPPFESKELCPVCRSDLDAFLSGLVGVAADADADEPPHAHTSSLNGRFGVTSEPPKRTCEICGRVGIQRFIETETGWRCSPTAVKCPGNKPASDIPEKEFPQKVAPPAEPLPRQQPEPDPEPEPARAPDPAPTPAAAAPHTPDVTARCQDCTRTYTLTGVPLRHAVEMHELKHGHIVNILEPAGAA